MSFVTRPLPGIQFIDIIHVVINTFNHTSQKITKLASESRISYRTPDTHCICISIIILIVSSP